MQGKPRSGAAPGGHASLSGNRQKGGPLAAFFRLIVFVLLAEAMFYLLLRIYIRSQRRERLEEIWDRRHPELAGNTRLRDEFVRKSMVGYDRTLKSRLLWLVFVVPNLVIIGIVIRVNWQ